MKTLNMLPTERKFRYQQANILFKESKFSEAEILLLDILKNQGSHVSILSDLCSISYMKQDYITFQNRLNTLKQELIVNQDLLSDESRMRTVLTIGQFSEEMLQVAEALSWYESGLSYKSDNLNIREIQIKIISQKLRLMSVLNFELEQLSPLYKICVSQYLAQNDILLDVEHSLLHAELEISGPEIALMRLNKLFSFKHIQEWDLRLNLFDFIAYCIGRESYNTNLFESLKKMSHQFSFETLDNYEKAIYLILWNKLDQAMQFLTVHTLTPFCRFRILNLFKIKNITVANELIQLLIADLSTENKKIFRSSFKLKRGNKLIFFENSESTFLKLRVSISRLNQMLEKKLGCHPVVGLKDGNLTIFSDTILISN